MSAIAVHPCNPGIIYAGTQFNFSAGTRGKLLKTTDCGATRDTLAVGGSYRTIQLQPGNPDVVYAVNGSILKTTNAGQSWQQAREGIELDSETGVGSLAINPQNACVLYAGTAWSGDVLRSTSGGNRWEPTGLVDTGSIVDELLVGSQDNKVIAGIRFKGFFYSVNRGSSWMPLTEIIKGDEFSTNKLIISPENNLKMYSTIKRLAHQSEDGGKNWFKQVGIDSLNNVQVKTISSEGEFLFGFSQNQGLTIIKTN
ncbi:MAG: hypothetical protein R3281_01340 [Balneolaceae bacterium]|nr:hypothetical protein [Balneolaceae bacterium]